MTLERAIEILNENRHRGETEWYIGGPPDTPLACTQDRYCWLESMEAILIADFYEKLATK